MDASTDNHAETLKGGRPTGGQGTGAPAPPSGERPVILAVILFLVFQAVFAWAQVPMDEIKLGVSFLGKQTALLEAKRGANARAAAAADFCHALLNTNEFLYVD